MHVRKGQGVPAYSIFEGTTDDGETLPQMLDEREVTDVDVVGIATDYCVRASALDALGADRRVRVLTDLVAGVAPESSAAALREPKRGRHRRRLERRTGIIRDGNRRCSPASPVSSSRRGVGRLDLRAAASTCSTRRPVRC